MRVLPQPVVAVVHCLRSRHGYGAGKGAGSFNFEAFSPLYILHINMNNVKQNDILNVLNME